MRGKRGKVALLALGIAACRAEAQQEPQPLKAPAEARIELGVVNARNEVLLPKAPQTPTPPTPPAPPASPYRSVRFEVVSSLERSFVEATDEEIGPKLTQVVKRALVWWVNPRRELYKGDRLEVVYEPVEDAEPIAHAIWFTSQKLGKTKAAVRFQAEGDKFARWYEPDGRELEKQLRHSPIEEYEQITSLLGDGRRHKGIDFKAPTGTPIRAPFSGRVVRRNWARRRNGNCLEIFDPKTKTTAYFLHLDRIGRGMRPGRWVKRGQQLATSGNTGRSFAPHLHYQLERRGRAIDPFRYYPTRRARLQGAQVKALGEELAQFEALRSGSS